MQQSYRSPRQPARTRSKPYARRQPPPRSGSIMATIRNIVTAPLSWFATTDEFEDTPGKRRRALASQSNVDAMEEQRSVKRQKVSSPPPQTQGYLDPPLTMFPPHSKPEDVSHDRASPTFLSPLPTNVNSQDCRPYGLRRHKPSTNIWSPRDQSREVSLENVSSRLITRDATMISLPPSRGASLSSVARGSSLGPMRAPFRMRTTLSPNSTGTNYGPNPKRRERDPSEPPPLTALMSNPIFVKPPPNHATNRSQSAQPTATLGALAQTSRVQNRISPRPSNLHLGDLPQHDPSLRPINASEIALSELAVYRTPLLPTRLRGSETIPEMFKPKKVHAIVPMKSGKRDLPRLGTGRKKRSKKEESTRKPYSAHGSVKKLLQRRKMEEEAEKGNNDNAMDTSEPATSNDIPSSSPTADIVANPLPELDVPQHRLTTREAPSLRVGRSRISRPDRPTSVRPSKTKFSAAFEDDDPVDQRGQDVQKLETKPMFEPPKGFTFARDKSETSAAGNEPPEPIKEPPIAALPFSLTPVLPKPSFPAAPALPAPQLAVPAISLSPPTPQRSDSSSTIPNFFANSSFLNQAPLPPLASGSLFVAAPVKDVPHPVPLATADQTSASAGTGNSLTISSPPETTTPIPPPVPSMTINSSSTPTFPVPSRRIAPPEPTPTTGGDILKASVPTISSTRQQPSLFEDSLSCNPVLEPTSVSVTSTAEPSHIATGSEQKISTPSAFSFRNTSGILFEGFGANTLTEGSKPFTVEQKTSTSPTVDPIQNLAAVETEAPKETKPDFSFTFKFGVPSTSPEKQTVPQLGEVPQDNSNPGIFTFGTSSNPAETQKPIFGSFPRPVTPPREEEEVRMEESPTRVVEATTTRPGENSFFAGRVLNFGQSNGSSNSPFSFGSASEDPNPFGDKSKQKSPAGFTFGSSGSTFDQPSPAFTFGKVDNPPQPTTTPSSPFTFGTSKLPEINTFGAGQTPASSPFNFGQRPSSSQGSPGFAFGQQQSPVATSSPFNFGQGQNLVPPPFGQQQNGSVPNSPSTFNQPLSFGFGSATPTSTSNPFSFQSSSPITTAPSNTPGFTFSQQSQTQAQPSTPVSPFPVPGSPQPAGGSLFNIGASPTVQSPGTRAIKKLPTRRGGARR